MANKCYLLLLLIFTVSISWSCSFSTEGISRIHNNQSIITSKNLSSDIFNETYVQALEYYDKALAIAPNATDILTNKGIVLMKLGSYNEAITVFDKILSLDSKNVGGLYNKGIALDKIGMHTEATEYQQKALEIDPNYVTDLQNRLSKAHSIPLIP